MKIWLDRQDNLIVLDMRSEKEWSEGQIEGAFHIYEGHLKERVNELSGDQLIAVICSVGNQASLGASILRRVGCQEVYTVLDSMWAWKKAVYRVT